MPKSFFKVLFIVTNLGAVLKRMSHSMAVLDGLKPQDVNGMWDRVNHPFPTSLRRM